MHPIRFVANALAPLGLLLVALLVGCSQQRPAPVASPTAPASTTVSRPPAPTAIPTPTPPPFKKGEMTSPDYGIQVFLWGNPGTTDRDLKLIKDMGFRWVKQMFQWNYIEGKGKGKYEWNEPDRIVEAIARHQLNLLVRVDFAPLWARGPGADPALDGPPKNMEDFGIFISQMARRYKGKVAAYQIWNEPNLARDWGGQPPNPAEYVRMLQTAYQAIKEADPAAIVITAGLSPTTAGGTIAQRDVDFLSNMYLSGLKGNFDLLGVHAAGFKSAPEADPAVVAKDPRLTNDDPSPEQARRVYAFRHVEDLRKIMEANGDGDKRIAVLEFGWTSDDRPGSPYLWHAVSEEQKARYMVEAFGYARDNWRPWIGLMSAIYIAAPHWTPNDEQYYWSITTPDGKLRPAYEALRSMKK